MHTHAKSTLTYSSIKLYLLIKVQQSSVVWAHTCMEHIFKRTKMGITCKYETYICFAKKSTSTWSCWLSRHTRCMLTKNKIYLHPQIKIQPCSHDSEHRCRASVWWSTMSNHTLKRIGRHTYQDILECEKYQVILY